MQSDVQIENGGYTRIHNAILEKLATTDLSGAEFRCLIFLLRKTYGFNKKEDRLSYDAWAEGTGLIRRSVMRSIKSLVDKKIIYFRDNGNNRPKTWGFNKYFEQWQLDESSVQNDTKTSVQNDTSLDKTGVQNDTSSDKTGVQNDTKTSVQNDTHKRNKKTVVSNYRDDASKTTEQPATATSFPSGKDEKFSKFVAEYERVWGMMIPSPYIQEKVESWAEQITVEAWTYGLQECVKQRQHGKWKYLEAILNRVAVEGLPEKATPKTSAPVAPPTVNFSLSDLLGVNP